GNRSQILRMPMPANQSPLAPHEHEHGTLQNLPLPPAELEQRFKTAPLVITAAEAAGGGVMGAQKLSVVCGNDDYCFDGEWKEAPLGGDGWNNSPRREIGVYEAQKLFLDPDDYIVPPVVVRGIEFEGYRAVKADPECNIDGTQCVYGALAAWLSNVKPLER